MFACPRLGPRGKGRVASFLGRPQDRLNLYIYI